MTNTDRELLAALIEEGRAAVEAIKFTYGEEFRIQAADRLDRAILNFELKSSLIREIPVD